MQVKYYDKLDSLKLRHRPVYEVAETGILKRELKPGQTFVDIGAHIGYYTLLASSLVGRMGVVFAFEASPENYSILQRNIESAGCTNVFPENEAVSIKTGVENLYLNPKNTGDNRLFDPGQPWPEIRIKTTCLDDYFAFYSGNIDFIKCDAQGHELSILYGAIKTLGRFPRLKMLMEYFPLGIKQNGDKPGMLISKLKDLGFTIVYPTKQIIEQCLPENGKHCNLFIRQGD